MDIYLYTMLDEKNRMVKTLNDELHISGTLRNDSSVIKPIILIEHQNPSEYNYMYIPDFNRYYFISSITVFRSGLWLISGKVDVLMSFSEQLENCQIILSLNESFDEENYMVSDSWQHTVKTKTDIINFPSGLNSTGEYVLITSGG